MKPKYSKGLQRVDPIPPKPSTSFKKGLTVEKLAPHLLFDFDKLHQSGAILLKPGITKTEIARIRRYYDKVRSGEFAIPSEQLRRSNANAPTR